MKPQIRILTYLLLGIVYFFSTSIFILLDTKLQFNNVYTTVPCGYAIVNLFFTFLIFDLKPAFNIICSILIPFLSLFLALQFSRLHLFSNHDPYDILTTIISNAVFSIIFWEIVYQLKTRKQ